MLELFNLLKWVLLDVFRSKRSPDAEVVALRQQLNVLRRSASKRPALKMLDRLILILLYRLAPNVLDAVTIVRPETIVHWHGLVFAPSGAGRREREGRADVLRAPVSVSTRRAVHPRCRGSSLVRYVANTPATSFADGHARDRRSSARPEIPLPDAHPCDYVMESTNIRCA
jgi:hypothetical protein